MSEADDYGAISNGAKPTGERIDQERREALKRFAKYTAPAMLGLLLSAENGMATVPPCSTCP
jgi:hypothetical protein